MIEPIVYRAPRWLSLAPAVLTIMGVAGCAGLVASALTGGPLWFVLFYLLIVAWMAYQTLPMSYEVAVADGLLSWRSFIGRGTAPISDVVRLSYVRSMASFELSDGRHVRVQVAKGWTQFTDALARAYPDHNRLRTVL